MIPNIAIVRVENPHWRGIRFWLPLFLLWIPAIATRAVRPAGDWDCGLAWGMSFAGTVATLWRILCSLPGTDVRVNADGNQ